MTGGDLNRIILILKNIREADDDEIKDCALDSLIEMLEDMSAETIKQEKIETDKSRRN